MSAVEARRALVACCGFLRAASSNWLPFPSSECSVVGVSAVSESLSESAETDRFEAVEWESWIMFGNICPVEA